MTRADFLLQLDELTRSPRGTVEESSRLLDIPGWDSLTTASFLLMAKNKLGVVLDGLQIERCETVSDLMSLVKHKLQ